MRKTFLLIVLVLVLLLAFAAPASATTIKGTGTDPLATWLGDIDYLFNNPGYHFWFTPTATSGPYVGGHRYHNVYKYQVGDPVAWCTAVIPNRAPYNIGGTAGATVYYQSWDTTTDTLVCPSS